MKRREFLKRLGIISAGTMTLSLGGFPLRAFASSPFGMNSVNGNILIILQLSGGNDGLNTVIPYTNQLYYSKRPQLGIAASSVVQLNSTIGLHPSLLPLKTIFDEGKLAVIQNVGYANPNRSHFRSTDIWLSASDSTQNIYDGWIGRYLTKAFPAYPGTTSEYPMAIQIGSIQSMLLTSQYGSMGVTFNDPNTFYQLVSGGTIDNDPPPNTLAGDELKFLKQIEAQSISYGTIIKQKADAGSNQVTYPTTSLGKQFAIVADLISGGLMTPVYLLTIGGFDNHSSQLTTHSNLLKQIADALSAFYNDMKVQNKLNKIAVMTFSEFGRRVQENASLGTDHGTAAPLFVLGGNIKGGITGADPNLADLDSNGDLKYKIDYRQVYGTMMEDHFGMSVADVDNVLLRHFEKLPVVITNQVENKFIPGSFSLAQNYPNPFNGQTTIEYQLPKQSSVRIRLYDIRGREIAELLETQQPAGRYTLKVGQEITDRLNSGTYIYEILAGEYKESRKMMYVK